MAVRAPSELATPKMGQLAQVEQFGKQLLISCSAERAGGSDCQQSEPRPARAGQGD